MAFLTNASGGVKNHSMLLKVHHFAWQNISPAVDLVPSQKQWDTPVRNLHKISWTSFMKWGTFLKVLMTITRQPIFHRGSIASMSPWTPGGTRMLLALCVCQGSHIHLEMNITPLQMVMMESQSCGGSVYKRVRTAPNLLMENGHSHLHMKVIARQQSSCYVWLSPYITLVRLFVWTVVFVWLLESLPCIRWVLRCSGTTGCQHFFGRGRGFEGEVWFRSKSLIILFKPLCDFPICSAKKFWLPSRMKMCSCSLQVCCREEVSFVPCQRGNG